jgi:hypothetical protein
MARQLYIVFVASGERSLITLCDEQAPVTCSTLWTALARPQPAASS